MRAASFSPLDHHDNKVSRVIVRLALAVGFLMFGGPLTAQEPADREASVAISLRIDPQTVTTKIPADFLGFGYETSAVAQPEFFNSKNTVLVQLYRTLTPHGVVRIGGNVSDHTRYVPDGTSAARPQTETTVINQPDLRDLGEFLRATGWSAIWGLNLGTGTKEDAVAEALAVDTALGGQLHSFEIGNEVDFLPRFSKNYDAYHAAYAEYKSAIRAVLPKAAFSGPDVAWNLDWCLKFADAEGHDMRSLTQHYYRAGATTPQATMESLLQHDTSLDRMLVGLRKASQANGISSRVCEVNSFYGGGKPGVSDTFGSALWCLDFLFQLASAGCGGVNMETDINHLGWVSHYSPIFHETDGRFTARPEYYALLAFSLAGNGDLVSLKPEGGAALNLCAYATSKDHGQLWVTIINKDLAKDADVNITVPGAWSGAQIYPLRAPTVGSTGQVTLAGAEVSADGKWTAQPQLQHPAQNGVWEVAVPHASATLLQFQH